MKVTAMLSKGQASRLVKGALLSVPLMIAPAVSGVVMQSVGLTSFVSGAVYAQEEAKKPARKTRKTPALREKVFKELAKVQELTNPEEEGAKANFPEALKVLNKISAGTTRGKWNQYELAQLYNYYGFVYYTLERFPEAIKYYKLVIAQSPQIPEGLEIGTLYTIAQLYFVQEDYKNAVINLKKWMALSPIVGADAYVLLGQAYYQMNDMGQALTNVNIAVKRFEDKGKVPKENWYSLQRALYYDKGDNKKVIEILEKMVRHFPKATYYKQLSGMFGAANREKDQLHMLDAAYQMGAVSKEKELLNLAYLYMGEDYPVRAAKVVEKGIKDKQIEATSKNLELLATAWRLAQEVKKSIPVMETAADKSAKGDLYARLAGIYLDNDRNKDAIKAGNTALKRKGIKRIDQLQIVLGMANANSGKYKTAINHFKAAAKDKRSKKFADQWITYCESEIKREKQLAAN